MTTAVETSHTGRRAAVIGAGLLIVALAIGVLPRLARRDRLAATVATNTGLPVVQVATADNAPASSSVTLPATLAGIESAPIYARVPGYVGAMKVDIGDRVKKGDLLAQIEAPELDFQVAQAGGTVAQTRATLELARANLARYKSMWADSAVTAQEIDSVQAGFGVATATLNSAEAAWRQLQQLQKYERVVAPFSGVITARNIDLGALVGTTGAVNGSLPSGAGSAAGSLFQLTRIDTLRIYVTVPEDNAASVRVGAPALVMVPSLPGDTLHGKVIRTSNALDPAARTLLAEIDVANPTGDYLPGGYAQAQITLEGASAALSVPATALVIRDGPPQVVMVGADSTVKFVPIAIGRDHGSWVEVTGGLTRGATLVINPPEDLQPGQRVRIQAAANTEAKGH